MPKISTRVTFDKKVAAAKIKAASNAALTDMGNQALQDVSQHVPHAQGTLKDSGIASSDRKAEDGKYVMRWSTPYAQYLWHGDVMYGNPTNRTYGPEKIRFTDAMAHEEWAKYAHEVYGAEWRKVYQAAMKRRVKA
jgi:hypothetical protein